MAVSFRRDLLPELYLLPDEKAVEAARLREGIGARLQWLWGTRGTAGKSGYEDQRQARRVSG